jgi:catechol 2,3-dioxygenase-like lactoylglutathione lyase family enzyme
MPARLEHANINVRSIDETIRFLTTAFPEFKVRGRGVQNGVYWLHIGTDDSYLALNELSADSPRVAGSDTGPLNHLGVVVDDAEAVADRLRQAGYQETFIVPKHPYRRRIYFQDDDGLEWEFVQYFSDDPAKRNEYAD